MRHLALEDFECDGQKMDSLYRVVNIAARRANQLNKPDTRSLINTKSKRTVIVALEEIASGKVWYRTGEEDSDEYDVG